MQFRGWTNSISNFQNNSGKNVYVALVERPLCAVALAVEALRPVMFGS